MTPVFLGLGSNIARERNLALGLDALQALFGELVLSPVYDSPAVGFDGDPFLNLVVKVQTRLALGDMAGRLRELEFAFGRPRNAKRYSARQLDIDVLTYGDLVGTHEGIELPRDEILEQAFVLRPLAELAPDAIHPGCGKSYAQLWQAFDASGTGLSVVDFRWDARAVNASATR